MKPLSEQLPVTPLPGSGIAVAPIGNPVESQAVKGERGGLVVSRVSPKRHYRHAIPDSSHLNHR